MPIRVHLDDLLAQRGMTLSELSSRVGITLANLSILKTGKARAVRDSMGSDGRSLMERARRLEGLLGGRNPCNEPR